MNRLSTKLMTAALATAALLSFGAASVSAQAGGAMAQATATATKAAKAAGDKMKAAVAPAPSDADIAAAKARGDVWVNLNTGKYHKSDAPTYGHTKNGKFMSEADAQKGGYKAAQEPMAKAKKAAATATSTMAPKQ